MCISLSSRTPAAAADDDDDDKKEQLQSLLYSRVTRDETSMTSTADAAAVATAIFCRGFLIKVHVADNDV